MSKVWMKVTRDEYALPVAVADTAKELAEMVGSTKSSVVACAHRGKKKQFHSVFLCVEVEDSDGAEQE